MRDERDGDFACWAVVVGAVELDCGASQVTVAEDRGPAAADWAWRGVSRNRESNLSAP